jgi:hypothetical protein
MNGRLTAVSDWVKRRDDRHPMLADQNRRDLANNPVYQRQKAVKKPP